MSTITTRKGDQGSTRLFSGEQVDKCSERPETYGDLDELVSFLGLARLHVQAPATAAQILQIQRDLFLVGSEIATTAETLERLPVRLSEVHMERLDGWRDEWETQLAPFRGFIIPAASVAAGYLDVCRTISRRLERKVVRLHRSGDIQGELILRFLNRLSDYLWLVARSEEDEPIMLKG